MWNVNSPKEFLLVTPKLHFSSSLSYEPERDQEKDT